MSSVLNGRVGKKRPRRSRRQVLRMMAIMQDGNNGEYPKEFLESGRTGRRNAMPEILSQQDVRATTADLPARLQALATNDNKNEGNASCDLDSFQCDSEEVLQNFLRSQCSQRRDALCPIPDVRTDDAKTKDSVLVSAHFINEEICKMLQSVVTLRSFEEPGSPKTENLTKEASDECLTAKNSEELLQKFLKSDLAKRRFAHAHIERPGITIGQSVTVLDEKEIQTSPHCSNIPVVAIEDGKFQDFLGCFCRKGDPNNPQPGPSTQASQTGDKEGAQKQKPSGS